MEILSKLLEVIAKAIGVVVGVLTVVKLRNELQGQRKTAPSSRSSKLHKRRR